MDNQKYILLTIDVEDWFQVENFKQAIPFSSWSSCELRVEKNTHRLLDLFESIDGQRTTDNGRDEKVRGTFFVLGWIAERLPHLVREIHSRGHEVASHGYCHDLCCSCSSQDLKKDLVESKKLLEDIIGDRVYGYRAPSFSISDDALEIIEDCGYQYDSSYNSFRMHGRYGKISLTGSGRKGIAHAVNENFHELPISNFRLARITFPLGGGGYFRLLPVPIFNWGVKRILRQQDAYVFYAHPWEFDPKQPKVNQASSSFKLRHYTNLYKTETRLRSFIESFEYCRFVTCCEYLNSEPDLGMRK